ncbi:hypothetical protein MK489_16885 [Myxococcota bacterium]|nr:hypothetical protein [Myxococcota bacterium]
MSIRSFWIFVVLLAAACNGPMGLLPGGKLGGEPRPAPSNWGFAGDYGTVQLETHPEEPYSVNIAYTIMGGRLFINAGGTETQWVKNMTLDPNVKLRLDGSLYDLRAVRVTDRGEIDRFAKAWTSQSMFRRDPSSYEQVWIYELVAR